jgi:FkbM family methyltransferase
MRDRLRSEVLVDDGPYSSFFVCDTPSLAWRALTLHVKEPGTMKWLDETLTPGSRFLDIGANIGLYTISAAHRVGPNGRVVAVEPHKPNVLMLFENIVRNGFADRIDVLSFPLTQMPTVAAFNYLALEPASSGSQFGRSEEPGGKAFRPEISELCLATSVDRLIADGAIEPPHAIKIDVDGIELSILSGMTNLLRSDERPRSVQVELNVGEQDRIVDFMANCGYALCHRHLTGAGEQMRAAGRPLAEIAHNAVFAPASLCSC